MNYSIVFKYLGFLWICEAIAMLLPLSVSIIYGENDTKAFLASILIISVIGLLCFFLIRPNNHNIYMRDGFGIVGFGWLSVSILGAMPFYISGAIPSFIDSVFETASGFTTTGASILTQIEGLPHGILFWRSFTHWMGGMGVLVLALALIPSTSAGALQIMSAESPGPNTDKLVPKVRHTAKILYSIYLLITLLEIISLKIAGLSLYDSLIHTFGTVGTGGFSNMNASVGAYDNVFIDIIIIFFMAVCGANFSLHYQALKGNIKAYFKDQEFKLYIGTLFFAIVLISLNILGPIYKSVFDSVRYASFQVVSIMTTTGYATADFDKWPMFSKVILVLLMFAGGSAGSTGGGMKQIRILLLFKIMRRELLKLIHPKAVYSVKIGDRRVDDKIANAVLSFFFMYLVVFAAAFVIVSLDNFDFATTVTSVVATISNIGPGLAMVGATGNYSELSNLSKIVLTFCMIFGRLELYPMLLLFVPKFWKKVRV